MKEMISTPAKSLLQFCASACGAVVATSSGNIALAGGLLALGASAIDLGQCVTEKQKQSFIKYLKNAADALDESIRLDAFVQKHMDDDDIDLCYAELNDVVSELNLTGADFVKWGLKPSLIEKALVVRLNDKDISPFFYGNEDARKLAGRIIFHGFTALRAQSAFWESTEIFFAESVLEQFNEMKTAQAAVKKDTEALIDGQGILNGKLEDIKNLIRESRRSEGQPEIPVSDEDALTFEKALNHLLSDSDNRKFTAREAVKEGRITDALHQLMSSARQNAAAADDLNTTTAGDFRQIGELTRAIDTAQAIEAYEQAIKYDGTEVWDYIYLARLYQRGGNLKAANEVVNKAYELDSSEWNQAVIQETIGDIHVAFGNLVAAKTAYENRLKLFQRIKEDENHTSSSIDREISVSYNKIGDVVVAQGDLAAARKAYQDGLNIAERLADADPSNTGFQRDLSVSYNKIGDVAVAQGDLADARKAYQDGLNIRERLADANTSNTGFQRDLSVSYERLGDVAVAQGDLAAARKVFQDSLNIRVRLADADPTNTEFQRDLSVSYERLGDVAVALDDLAAARKAFQDALNIAERLADTDPSNTGYQRDLAISYERLASLAINDKDFDTAKSWLEKELQISLNLERNDPTNASMVRFNAVVKEILGNVHSQLDDQISAKEQWNMAYESLQGLKNTGRLQPKDENILQRLSHKVEAN